MQETIRYIAIDDNLVDMLLLKEYASAFPFLEHEGSYSTAIEGLTAAEACTPDLVFLDIEMPGLSGLKFCVR